MKKEPVEMFLVFSSQDAAEFRPSLDCLFDKLNKSGNGTAHVIPLLETARMELFFAR